MQKLLGNQTILYLPEYPLGVCIKSRYRADLELPIKIVVNMSTSASVKFWKYTTWTYFLYLAADWIKCLQISGLLPK